MPKNDSSIDKKSMFRGQDVQTIVNNLEILERNSKLFATDSDNRLKYVFSESDNEAIICSYFQRIIQLKVYARSILRKKSLQSSFQVYGKSVSHANRIKVKNNIIAFYDKPKLVVKFTRTNGFRSSDSLQAEAKYLKIIGELSFLNAPRVIVDNSAAEAGQLPALWLEKISGRPPDDAEKKRIAQSFMSTLLKWYDHNGVDFVRPSIFNESLQSMPLKLHELGWNHAEGEVINKALLLINNCEKLMPVSLIHGDASTANVLLQNTGKMIILDWELSRKYYIAADVYKLARQADEIMPIYADWIRKFNGITMISPDLQISIITILDHIDLEGKKPYLNTKMTPEKIEEKFRVIKSQVVHAAKKVIELL